jgi:hypothetical protein
VIVRVHALRYISGHIGIARILGVQTQQKRRLFIGITSRATSGGSIRMQLGTRKYRGGLIPGDRFR